MSIFRMMKSDFVKSISVVRWFAVCGALLFVFHAVPIVSGQPRFGTNNRKAKIVNLAKIAAKSPDLVGEDEEPAELDTYLSDPLADKRLVPPGAISPFTRIDRPMFNRAETSPLIPSPATSLSFQSLPDSNTSIPPDTHGAAGPNHLMTVLNSQIRIQDKTGAILLTTTLNAFWAPVAPSGGVFDPKILYDPYSGRWLFTALVGSHSTSSGILMATSQTSDPTGNWFAYNAQADSTGVSWADYPSFGFNKDWIIVSVNMFPIAGGNASETRTFIFRKTSIFSGTFNVGFFARPGSEGFSICPAITYSATEPTMYLLSSYNGNSGGNGFLRLYTITGSVGSELFTTTNVFPNSGGNTWASSLPDNFVPQSGTNAGIMTGDQRMQGVVLRNGSLWATHSVFTPASSPARSAVQWWQIDPVSGAVSQIGRVEDLGNNSFYAFPSIAVNQNNDVLVGYATFSSSAFAAASYSFRAASDTLGTLRDSRFLKTGLGCYIKTFGASKNRWGDYSNSVVDPTDDTNFWTIQEYADAPAGSCSDGTGRWGTWWGKVSSNVSVSVSGHVFTSDGRPLRNAIVSITNNRTGAIQTALTSSFGNYQFDNVGTGDTYTINVGSKHYRFLPQTVAVNSALTNLDFTGDE